MSYFEPPPSDIEEQRKRIYCRNKSPEGYVCDLYKDHFGDCKDKHNHHSWQSKKS